MRRDDYILMIASGLLKLNSSECSDAMHYFGQSYEFSELRKSGFISLGGTDGDRNEIPFDQWITILRDGEIKDVQCLWASHNHSGNLAPHIAAAFAGSQLLVLNVTQTDGSHAYLLRTYFSSQNEIKPEDFTAVIDAQNNYKFLWERIAEMVQKHNELNNRESFEAKDIKEYLTKAGRSEFDFLASQLIQEVQVECAVMDDSFVIPDGMKHLFYKSDFSFGDSGRKSVFLYPLKEVTVDEVKELVAAQSFHDEIWEQLVTDLEQSGMSDLPSYSAKEWPDKLTSISHDQQSSLFNFICRSICSICEAKEIARVIPDHLTESFGPDELDHKRAQARGSSDVWYLDHNKNAWEAYIFEEMEDLTIENQIPVSEARTSFIKALENISAFASKMQSPFVEAFLLGLFFLREENQTGAFDDDHSKQLIHKLKQENFSDQAQEQFSRVMQYASDMNTLKFPSKKIGDLLAVSIADVFGGMGSWNDQYFESDQETYDRLSADLFQSLKVFFSSALSQ